MMKIVFLSEVLLFVGSVLGLFRAIITLKWLKKNKPLQINDSYVKNNFFIVVPVLYEQSVIMNSLRHFSKLSNERVKVIYVTTEKEQKSGNEPTTAELIDNYLSENPVLNIERDHYPYPTGVMANQINWAVNKITDPDVWIGIYNVDSEINTDTLKYIDCKDKNTVFQQYAYFLSSGNKVIDSAARWQNRWSFCFEFAKVIETMWKKKKRIPRLFSFLESFNYVIGHGLFFTKKQFDFFGGVPEDTLNEDNKLGYILSVKQVNLEPIPFFEKALFAHSIKVYIKQQSTWFNGPFYAFLYLRQILHSSDKLTASFIFRSFILSFKNYWAAVNWCLFPLIVSVSVLIALFNSQPVHLILLFAGIFCYVSIPNYVGTRLIYNFENIKKPVKIFTFIGDTFFFFIHCIGPLITIKKHITKQNSFTNKYKTVKVRGVDNVSSVFRNSDTDSL